MILQSLVPIKKMNIDGMAINPANKLMLVFHFLFYCNEKSLQNQIHNYVQYLL